MPGMDGAATLAEMSRYRPDVQVVMLTAHGSVERAAARGRQGVFRFLAKPVPLDDLEQVLWEADREHAHALARRDMPLRKDKRSPAPRLRRTGARPVLVILSGLATLLLAGLLPPAPGLVTLLGTPRAAERAGDPVAGYAAYQDLGRGRPSPTTTSPSTVRRASPGRRRTRPARSPAAPS